jgi:hypothetical protein
MAAEAHKPQPVGWNHRSHPSPVELGELAQPLAPQQQQDREGGSEPATVVVTWWRGTRIFALATTLAL